MAAERSDDDAVREFRLEGVTLGVVAVVLVVLLAGAFYLGRWVERGSGPGPGAVGLEEDPLAGIVTAEEPVDVDEGVDHFDDVAGEGKELEPQREARPATPPPAEAAERAPPRTATSDSGTFFVQIWAGRDRKAGELLVGKLRNQGFQAGMFSQRGEGDTLFKVRVGGYETEADAREASADLESQGYRGAWVTTAP